MSEYINNEKEILLRYEKYILEVLGADTYHIAMSFMPGVASCADKVEPIEDGTVVHLRHMSRSMKYRVTYYQDFSFGSSYSDALTDVNVITMGDYKFLEIVTSFVNDDAKDFIITKAEEFQGILEEYLQRRVGQESNKYLVPTLIGVPVEEIRSHTIEFLLNEEFRNYCDAKGIRLKRGVMFAGEPGNGKTAVIQYLQKEAVANGIDFRVFTPDEFLRDEQSFYAEGKKIFVFEDFDTYALERGEGGGGQVLSKLLQDLDGVRQIDDVVSVFTTNTPEKFDKAVLRPGRIHKIFTFSPPTEDNRRKYLETYLKDKSEFYPFILKKTKGFSYAMLRNICDEVYIHEFEGIETSEEFLSTLIEEVKKHVHSKGQEEHVLDSML